MTDSSLSADSDDGASESNEGEFKDLSVDFADEDCLATWNEMLNVIYEYNLLRIWSTKWMNLIGIVCVTKEHPKGEIISEEGIKERLMTVRSRFQVLILKHNRFYLSLLKHQSGRMMWWRSLENFFDSVYGQRIPKIRYTQGEMVILVVDSEKKGITLKVILHTLQDKKQEK